MAIKLRDSALETAIEEGFFWGDNVAKTYFEQAEKDMEYHWTRFVEPFINDIEYDVVLDLAAGHGRNSAILAGRARRVICVDINPDNIAVLNRRFTDKNKFRIIQNDGVSLDAIPTNEVDLVYCFDSMVHFDLEIIQLYIKEIHRILRPSGHAFLHCSNYTRNPGGDFRKNPHWRNFFSAEILLHLAQRSGLIVSKIAKTPWGGIEDLDCMALLHRPTASKGL